MKKSIVTGALIALALTGCSQGVTANGEVAVHLLDLAGGMSDISDAMECKTTSGSAHDYLVKGADIVAYNEKGEVVGKGTLGTPTRSNDDPDSTDLDCLFPFSISGINDVEFLTLKVGDSESKPFSRDELNDSLKWSLD